MWRLQIMTNKDYKPLTTGGYANPKMLSQYRDRLCYLEDCIGNGTLVFLPCKVGDKVWYLNEYSYPRRIEEYVVDSIELLKGGWMRCTAHSEVEPMGTGFSLNAIGDYIFTTKEAAEKALEELENDKRTAN